MEQTKIWFSVHFLILFLAWELLHLRLSDPGAVLVKEEPGAKRYSVQIERRAHFLCFRPDYGLTAWLWLVASTLVSDSFMSNPPLSFRKQGFPAKLDLAERPAGLAFMFLEKPGCFHWSHWSLTKAQSFEYSWVNFPRDIATLNLYCWTLKQNSIYLSKNVVWLIKVHYSQGQSTMGLQDINKGSFRRIAIGFRKDMCSYRDIWGFH